MAEQERRIWHWVVAALIGLPVLYAASFGPACWLWGHGWISLETIAVITRPMAWLNCSPFCLAVVRDAIYWWGTLDGIGITDIELFFLLQ